MTAVATLAGAPTYGAVDWPSIDWKKVNCNVRRLQARIVKAIKEKRWGKVKALQWLLTHSFSGKALAVRRVTENRGKKTPGVDGEIWDTPKKKAQGIRANVLLGNQLAMKMATKLGLCPVQIMMESELKG